MTRGVLARGNGTPLMRAGAQYPGVVGSHGALGGGMTTGGFARGTWYVA